MAVIQNDNKILNLKEQITKKKATIKATERFTPVTNCLLDIEGRKHNLNVLKKDELIHSLVLVNSYHQSAINLDLQETFKLSGFTTTEWIQDIKAKLAIINLKEEKAKLLKLEEKLSALLSAEKKVELELNDLENTINNL